MKITASSPRMVMSVKEYADYLERMQSPDRPSHMRIGQWASNELHARFPNIARQYTGSNNDPFYQEGWPKNFFKHLFTYYVAGPDTDVQEASKDGVIELLTKYKDTCESAIGFADSVIRQLKAAVSDYHQDCAHLMCEVNKWHKEYYDPCQDERSKMEGMLYSLKRAEEKGK